MNAGRPVLVIPAFNEAQNLPKVLPEATARLGQEFEIVVVDDGSRDGTAEVAAAHGVRVLRHPFNLGYGAALQTGYKFAMQSGATLLVQMDADGQHDPGQVPIVTEPVQRNEYDLVVGSRFLEPTNYQMDFAKRVGKAVFRGMAGLSGLELTDPTSGFQAMNRAVLELYANDFYPQDYPDVDVLLTAHRHGLRIGERTVTMSKGLRESSLHGGLRAFYYTYKMTLSIWAASAVTRARGA
jgi:glycosyltransferase involved in cell wall biosynthesis